MYEQIAKRTLLDGGYTHSKQGTRYAVAVNGHTLRIPVDGFNGDHIRRYHQKHPQFGTWVHDGLVWLDVVETYESEAEALQVADERLELAIFDLVNKAEIFLK